jgi:hypothetical protein
MKSGRPAPCGVPSLDDRLHNLRGINSTNAREQIREREA